MSLWALARVHPEDKDLRRQTTEQLIARLKDQDPFVRVAAARGLAALPPAPEITRAHLGEGDCGRGREDGPSCAGCPGGAGSAGRAAVDRRPEVREASCRGRVYSGADRSGCRSDQFPGKLIDDKNGHIAHEAALALGNIGPGAKDAVPALVKALQQGEDEESNFASVVYALGRIGPGAAAAEPVLVGLLQSADRNLALLSAWALAQIPARFGRDRREDGSRAGGGPGRIRCP